MPWYLQVDHYPFSNHDLEPERKDVVLDCPDDIFRTDLAIAMAQKMLAENPTLKNEKPILVWKQEIPGYEPKRRRQ